MASGTQGKGPKKLFINKQGLHMLGTYYLVLPRTTFAFKPNTILTGLAAAVQPAVQAGFQTPQDTLSKLSNGVLS